MKRLNDFEVTDIDALAAAYPRMVKLTPDYGNIRKALALGVNLPGVKAAAADDYALAASRRNEAGGADIDDLLQSDHDNVSP